MSTVAPYCGQNQTSRIAVPARILYQSYQYSPEEGPWAMIPYAWIYPPPAPPEWPWPPPIQPPPVMQQRRFLYGRPVAPLSVAPPPPNSAWVPPPVQTTDLFSAQQTYPL